MSHRHIILLSLHLTETQTVISLIECHIDTLFCFHCTALTLNLNQMEILVSHRHIILLSLHQSIIYRYLCNYRVTSTHYFAFIALSRLLVAAIFPECHIDTLFCFHCTCVKRRGSDFIQCHIDTLFCFHCTSHFSAWENGR